MVQVSAELLVYTNLYQINFLDLTVDLSVTELPLLSPKLFFKATSRSRAEDTARRLHKPGQAHARPNSLAPRGGSKNSGRVRLARADPGAQESDYWEPGVAKALAIVAPGDQKGSPNFSHEGLGGTAGPKLAQNLVPLSPTMCVSSSRGDQSRKKKRDLSGDLVYCQIFLCQATIKCHVSG